MACPQYLAMGMSFEQYWDEPPILAVAYRDAYKLKREVENEQAWLQGIYFYDAIAVCLANAFSKRGAKKQNYLEKPIDIFPLTDSEKKIREQEEMKKMQKALEKIVKNQQRKKKSKGE